MSTIIHVPSLANNNDFLPSLIIETPLSQIMVNIRDTFGQFYQLIQQLFRDGGKEFCFFKFINLVNRFLVLFKIFLNDCIANVVLFHCLGFIILSLFFIFFKLDETFCFNLSVWSFKVRKCDTLNFALHFTILISGICHSFYFFINNCLDMLF